ncbi:MAG: helix-turn-helix domain-containing protein, partial [Sphingobacteriales bacterium]
MMSEEKVLELIAKLESDWIERTRSTADDKLGQAICAFSNDFPNHRHSGYILLGVNDDGSLAGKVWTDEELQKIGGMKTNGKILPQPSLIVSSVFKFSGGEVVVIEVRPSTYPPVRYDGRCWIRVGPRRDKASLEEERILTERRVSNAKTFDLAPSLEATTSDMSIELFKSSYLTYAI